MTTHDPVYFPGGEPLIQSPTSGKNPWSSLLPQGGTHDPAYFPGENPWFGLPFCGRTHDSVSFPRGEPIIQSPTRGWRPMIQSFTLGGESIIQSPLLVNPWFSLLPWGEPITQSPTGGGEHNLVSYPGGGGGGEEPMIQPPFLGKNPWSSLLLCIRFFQIYSRGESCSYAQTR